MNKEELKLLQEKYESMVSEKTIDEIKKMCDQGELDINAAASSIWVVNYSGDEPAVQAEMLLNQLVESNVTRLIAINHEELFKKIYAVKDFKGQQDIIVVLKDANMQIDNFNELYSATADMFSLKNYLTEQLQLNGTYVKEEYDPLNFKGRQAEVDEIEEKYANGEITLGEMFQKFGWIDEDGFDKDKIADIVEKLVSGELNTNDIINKIQNKELNDIELTTIQDIIKKRYPDVYEKLNEQI